MTTTEFDAETVWTFSDRLRKARRNPLGDRPRLGQEEMAAAIGVPAKRYQNWEAGSAPRLNDAPEVARRVAALTGYPDEWLLGIKTRWDWESPAVEPPVHPAQGYLDLSTAA